MINVELSRSNQYWLYTIISSAYTVTFDNRTLDEFLYVVDKKDVSIIIAVSLHERLIPLPVQFLLIPNRIN